MSRRAETGLAFVATLGLLLLYVLTFPRRLYGDDAFFVHCIQSGWEFTVHPWFMPIARAWCALLEPLSNDTFFCLQLLSAIGGASGAFFLYLAARQLDLPPAASAIGVLLVAGTPSWWFFSTIGEVHGLHAGSFGLLLYMLARLRPRSHPVSVAGAMATLLFALGTHQSALLFVPAAFVIYLVQTRGRSLQQRAFDLLASLLPIALAIAGVLAVAHDAYGSITKWREVFGPAQGMVLDKLRSGWDPLAQLRFLGMDWTAHAFALVWLGCIALGIASREARPRALMILLWIGPYLFFSSLFGYYERGGYLLPTLPALALGIAVLLGTQGPQAPKAFSIVTLIAIVGGLIGPDFWVGQGPNPLWNLPPIEPEIPSDQAGKGIWILAVVALTLGLFVMRSWRPVWLIGVVALQGVGTAFHVESFDTVQRRRQWVAAVITETKDQPTTFVTEGFGHYYLLLVEKPDRLFVMTFLAMKELPPEQVAREVDWRIAGGQRVIFDERVWTTFETHPIVQHLRETFDVQAVTAPAFDGRELRPKSR